MGTEIVWLCTLHPSHIFLTELRTFIPRVCCHVLLMVRGPHIVSRALILAPVEHMHLVCDGHIE